MTYEELVDKAESLGIKKLLINKGFETAVVLMSDLSQEEINVIAEDLVGQKRREAERTMKNLQEETNESVRRIEKKEADLYEAITRHNNAFAILESTAKKYEKLYENLRNALDESNPMFETAEYRDKFLYDSLTKTEKVIVDDKTSCARCIFRNMKWEFQSEGDES